MNLETITVDGVIYSIFGSSFRGSIYFANLPTVGMRNGDWYDIKDDFTTDNRFEEGSGITCYAGTDVIWNGESLKWNILTVNSGKADKVSGATPGNFAGLDSNGNLTDSGKKQSDFVTDVSGKADKVSSAISGNFAGLDGNGNLTDSGKKASDFVTDISGKADKVSGAENGNFAGLDSNGNLTDSGKKASDFLTSHQTIKQDGVTGATVNRYGSCSTAASTAAKEVSVTAGTFSLEAGARVSVNFSNANTASSPTLNVGSTGAKNIYHNGSQITTGDNKALLAGTVDFVYDGTQYQLVGNYISGGGGTGGHTILDSSGTAMTSRSKLQFMGATVTDDSGNDKTIVTGTPQGMISDAWASGNHYVVGIYRIYNNTLYKCNTEHDSTASNYPGSSYGYWTAEKVGEALTSLNSGLTDNTEYNLFPVYTSATTDIYGNVNSSYVLTASSAPWGTGWEAHNAFQDYYHNWQSSNAKNQYIQYLNSGETLPLPAKKIAGYYVFASEPSVITRPVQCEVYINGSWHIIGSKTFTRTNGEAEKFEFEIDESLYPYIYGIKLSSTGTTAYTLSFSSLRLISR